MVMKPTEGALVPHNSFSEIANVSDLTIENTSQQEDKLEELIENATFRKNRPIVDGLVDQMLNNFTTPIEDFATSDIFSEGRFYQFGEETEEYRQAIFIVKGKFKKMLMRDWFNHLLVTKPIYNIFSKYLPIRESVKLIKDWCKFQFGEDGWMGTVALIKQVMNYL